MRIPQEEKVKPLGYQGMKFPIGYQGNEHTMGIKFVEKFYFQTRNLFTYLCNIFVIW